MAISLFASCAPQMLQKPMSLLCQHSNLPVLSKQSGSILSSCHQRGTLEQFGAHVVCSHKN